MLFPFWPLVQLAVREQENWRISLIGNFQTTAGNKIDVLQQSVQLGFSLVYFFGLQRSLVLSAAKAKADVIVDVEPTPAVESNPFRLQESEVQLVADFGTPDEPVETIRFDDAGEPTPEHVLGIGDAIAGYTAAFNDSAAQIDKVLAIVEELKRSQLTKDDVRTVVKEELEAFKQVLIEWRDTQGKVSTAAVPVDEKGVGTVDLPPGAVVTKMGGVSLEQWRLENPGASVADGSVGGGSTGGRVVANSGSSHGSVSTSYQQQAIPMAVAHWESDRHRGVLDRFHHHINGRTNVRA